MKAIVFDTYGSPEEVLRYEEAEKPLPKANEILIKVVASAVNDYDWSLVRGKPYLYRLMFGLFKPKNRIIGMELSGTVESIGSEVKNFKPGDPVYGDISEHGFGTFAEYLCIDENAVRSKPEALSFEEAVAIPHASTLAWQALKDIGKIKQGDKVLINGGGGGVGTIGLQLAKIFHCEVTGVDTEEKLARMLRLGFDQVFDYRKVDFTKIDQRFDLILDCKTSKSAFSLLRALTPQGIYVTIGGKLSSLIGVYFWRKPIKLFSKKNLNVLGLKPNKDLHIISDLIVLHKIKCDIDGPYPIQDTPRLVQYFGEGKHHGKIVVKIDTE